MEERGAPAGEVAGADTGFFKRGGLRPAIRKKPGGWGVGVGVRVLSASGPIQKAGVGGGGCCPLQARSEKRGGGGSIRFRHNPKSGGEGGGTRLAEEGEVPYMKGEVATTKPSPPPPPLDLPMSGWGISHRRGVYCPHGDGSPDVEQVARIHWWPCVVVWVSQHEGASKVFTGGGSDSLLSFSRPPLCVC